MKLVPFVLKNVFRKKTRSILTLGAILLPLFVICFMGTMLETLNADPSGGKGMFRVIVRHKVSLGNPIPAAYEERIRQIPGVKATTTYNWFGGQYIDAKPENMFSRFSTNKDTFFDLYDEITVVAGSAEEWKSDRSAALVGQQLMKKYGWKLGDRFTLKGDIYPITLELVIRAVFKGSDETQVFFDHKILEESVPWAKGTVGCYWVKADSPESIQRLTREIDALFENSPFPTKTETEKEFQNGFVSMLGNVKLMVTGISGAIVLVMLLIAANTMAMSARERVTEIAVLRVLGFRRGTILGIVLGESLFLAVFGGLLGIGLFALIFPGFKEGLLNSPMGGFAAAIRLFPSVLTTAFTASVLVGLLAGLVPAIRSAQRPITEGLRQVG